VIFCKVFIIKYVSKDKTHLKVIWDIARWILTGHDPDRQVSKKANGEMFYNREIARGIHI
jgi:hypothetical protein